MPSSSSSCETIRAMINAAERTMTLDGFPAFNADTDRHLPDWTWRQLEFELSGMAGSEERRRLVGSLVAAMERQSVVLSAREMLRHLLTVAWVVLDETPEQADVAQIVLLPRGPARAVIPAEQS